MDRRHFVAQAIAQLSALSIAPSIWAMGEKTDGKGYGTAKSSPTVVNTIGNNTLTGLREYHRKELNEKYIPFWDKQGIDWEYGGVASFLNDKGDHTFDRKEMYWLGRAIWVFSYLYNHFGKQERHLKAARITKEFIYKHCRDENGYWVSIVDRTGKVLQGSYNIYGDIYVCLGLCEYFLATGEKESLDTAIETAYGVTKRITSPEYQHLAGHGGGHEPGTKRLGTWQHFLSALTPLARQTDDEGIGYIARMCVRNILERHYRPEYGLAFEHLDDQFQPFRVDSLQDHRSISGWHSIQAAWMCMDEALRTGSRDIFMDAMEFGRKTLEHCWAEGEKGGLINIPNPESKAEEPQDYAPSGAMDDALVFALLAIEHTHAPWAIYWFDKVFTHGNKKPERWRNICLLHHPRRLFFCINILDRMIARGGRVSDFLEG